MAMYVSPVARAIWVVAVTLTLSLTQTGALFAQSTGRIGGTVTDPTGGVVPSVSVTCKNLATGISRAGETNQVGIFEFPDLPIGQYQLEFKKQGFQSQKRDRVPLVTGQVLDLKIQLQLGEVTQSVTVSSEPPLVESTSSAVETSVTVTQMRELPLNGRNPLQLTTLTPGTAITDVGTEYTQQDNRGITVNGLRATQNNFQLDGAIYNDRFFDSVPTMPDPDALEEFTIQSSNYSAEHGGAGALVQLSVKSGTNDLHGTAFEFLRNTELNARNFFANIRPPFKLNQFGGTVGGPIRKNRTFFFFSAQDTERRSAPSPLSFTPPTAAQRTGDFSALLPKTQLVDPRTGQPIPGNIIPPSRLDPVLVKVANALLPLPNSGTQFVGIANQNLDDTQYLVKIDHQVSNNNHLSGSYFYDQDNFQRPFNAPTGFYALNLFRNQTATLNDTQIFSPTLTASFYATAGRLLEPKFPWPRACRRCKVSARMCRSEPRSLFSPASATTFRGSSISSPAALCARIRRPFFSRPGDQVSGATSSPLAPNSNARESTPMTTRTLRATTRSTVKTAATRLRTSIWAPNPLSSRITAAPSICGKTASTPLCRTTGRPPTG